MQQKCVADPFEPQAETSANTFCCVGLHFALLGGVFFIVCVGLHFVFVLCNMMHILCTELLFGHNLMHIRLYRRQAQASHSHRTVLG